ncbi:putative F-box protein [Cardamine amara subsp. amara]|uniref:F-box protein n=1 Tax=Cardamine amara subsp. amara TaxID=228776 RepID=A0ABD0ZJ80_CARAN
MAMEDLQPSPPRNLAHAGKYSTKTILFDITFEILFRIPPKSIIRFQSVSKLWLSIIRSKEFVDSFLARSKTRPRLLFTFKQFESPKRFIFSTPEHQKNDNSTTAIAARHDMTISGFFDYVRSPPVNGFVCFTRGSSILVCNLTTRQIVKLPDVESNEKDMFVRLGYDPVEDQYKVLCLIMFDGDDANQQDHIQQKHFVFTLSSQQKEWRKIENTTGDDHRTVFGGISIDGAIYYGVENEVIVRFDVRTEKLELIQVPEEFHITTTYYSTLLNYTRKLGDLEMRLWIIEWSKMTYTLPSEWDGLLGDYVRPKSVMHSGELNVVYPRLQSSRYRFGVCYYDVKGERISRMEIPGIGDDYSRIRLGIGKRSLEILSFLGYVENIRVL